MLQFKPRTLRAVACALGAQTGVDVKVQGDTAYTSYDTDPPVIVIPDLDMFADDKTAVLARGYLDHEAGHVRFTDRDLLRKFNDWMSQKKISPVFCDHFMHELWNIYEDVYIERKMGTYFKGCASNLHAIGTELFVESGPKNVFQTARTLHGNSLDKSPSLMMRYLMTQILLYTVRGRYNPDIQARLDEWIDFAKRGVVNMGGKVDGFIFDSMVELHDKLQPLADKSMKAKCSKDNLDLAFETLEIMREIADRIASDNKQLGDTASQRQSQIQNAMQSGSTQGMSPDMQKACSDSSGNFDRSKAQQELDKQSKKKDGADKSQKSFEDLARALKARADARDPGQDSGADDQKFQDNLSSLRHDPSYPRGDELSKPALGGEEASGTDLGAKAGAALAKEQKEQVLDGHKPKTSDAKVHDVSNMNKLSRQEKLSVPRRVSRAVDNDDLRKRGAACGNSLGRRLRSLLQTQSLVRRGLASCGNRIETSKVWRVSVSNPRVFRHDTTGRVIDTEVVLLIDASGSMSGPSIDTAFTALLGMVQAVDPIRECSLGAVAFTGSEVYVLKKPGDSLRVKDIPYVDASGGTYIGGAYRAALEQFTGKARRNICIVLSDGEASDPSVEVPVFKEAHDEAVELGVDTLGIGLGDTHLKELVGEDKFVFVHDWHTLPEALFDLLKKAVI